MIYDVEIEKESFKLIKFFSNFYTKNITQFQKEALDFYKGAGYMKINEYLISSKQIQHSAYTKYKIENIIKEDYKILYFIKELDKIFKEIKPYNEKITVYRGLNDCNKIKDMIYILENAKIGKKITFPTFLSTSLNIKKANNFVGYQDIKSTMNKIDDIKKSNEKISIVNNDSCLQIIDEHGKKNFFLMKINIPKNNKILYLERFYKYQNNIVIENWENEILLPRNSTLKLIKRYDEIFQKNSSRYLLKNIINKKVVFYPTRVYEFEYVGYDESEFEIPDITSLDIRRYFENKKNKKTISKVKEELEKEIKEKESKKGI